MRTKMKKILPFVIVSTLVTLAAPPANDNFVNRIVLPGASGIITGTTAEASLESGEPAHAYYLTFSGTNSIWYTWTAPATATYCFNTGNTYNNIVCAYTGNSITNLKKVAYMEGGITFNATNGVVYNIAVINYTPISTNEFILQYTKTDITDWFDTFNNSGRHIKGYAARNGSLAYCYAEDVALAQMKTNYLGGIVSYVIKFYNYPLTGITILDKKGKKRVDNVLPSSAGTNFFIMDFNGKNLLLYDPINSKLLLYKVKKDLTLVNEQILQDVIRAYFCGSKIIAIQYNFMMLPNDAKAGITIFDKKLKRVLYSQTPKNQQIKIQDFYKQIHTCFSDNAYTLTITSYKKGKTLSQHKVDIHTGKDLALCIDGKGGLLYWERVYNGFIYQNSSLNYIDKKGNYIFQNKNLPDIGSVWEYAENSIKNLFIIFDNGSSKKISAFKINKNLKKIGESDVSNLLNFRFDGKFFIAEQYLLDQYGVTSFNLKMKEFFAEPLSQGIIDYLHYNTFVRETEQPNGSYTNFIFKIFNKKKTIAEHSIIY